MAEQSGRTRTFILAVVASAAVIAVTVVFANVTSTSRVVEHAEELHHLNATLGTAALARAAAGQAALFDDLLEQGLASREDAEVARGELRETTSALRELADGASPPVASHLERLLMALTDESLDPDAVESRYVPTAERLGERIGELESEIARSEQLGGYMSGAIRLLVALIIPAAVILIYRKRASEQVKEERVRMQALLEAEREIGRAKDRFVAGMSHEIRTPLTGICGFTEVLLDTPPDAPIDRDTVGIIHSEAFELSRMVDDFIATSRLEGDTLEVKPEEAELAEVVGSVVERFERMGAAIRFESVEAPAMLDRGRVRHILTNLLSNALLHGGSPISVEIEGDGAVVHCHVRDEGPGIPAELGDRLFTRFLHDGDEALTTGSLGLGSWVARQLAQAMDGDVTFRRDDEQTVFTLTLPAPPPPEQAVVAPVAVGATT